MSHAPLRALRARPGHVAPHQPPKPESELAALVCAARTGDNSAWTELVRRFDGTLRMIARSYRLTPSDIDDVVQATWLRLFRHIDGLREPSAIAAWLATTTRRESLRLLQAPVREQLTDDPYLGDCPVHDGPETALLATEHRALLARALATLPDRHRRLMTLLVAQPSPDYQQLSAMLGMPMGSIGPIRARSLARLRRHPELRTLRRGATDLRDLRASAD